MQKVKQTGIITSNKRIYVFLSIIVLIAALGLFLYSNALKRELSSVSCQTITELLGQQRLTFISQLEGEMAVAETIAALSRPEIYCLENQESTLEFLQNAVTKSRFSRVMLVNSEGMGFSSENVWINVSQLPYYQKAMAGNTIISDPFSSIVDSTAILDIATPVYDNGKVCAVFIGSFSANDLSKLFFASYGGEGFAYIADADGNIISRASRQRNDVQGNILEYLKPADFLQYDSYSTIVQNMRNGLSGHSVYTIDGQTRLMHYEPMYVNDWYIFTTVPEYVVSSQRNYILLITTLVTIAVAVLFTMFFLYIIFSHKKQDSLLYEKAYYNPLTGIPNLSKFREDGAALLKKYPGKQYVTLRISIQDLSFFNEIYGYQVGDSIIIAVAQSIQEACNPQIDCFCHLDGDRFLLLIQEENTDTLQLLQVNFKKCFNAHMENLIACNIKFAIGIYFVEAGETDISAIIEKANFAHHIAKKSDRIDERIQLYNNELKTALTLEREVENKMEQALENNEFVMFLQPKYDITNNTLVGAEGLARWWVKGRYIMYPTDFIPIFEKNGFVVHLDMFMFEEACKFIKKLLDENKKPIKLFSNPIPNTFSL